MANTILKTRAIEDNEPEYKVAAEEIYLQKDNYLSEFSDSEDHKQLVRTNIGAVGINDYDQVTNKLQDDLTGLNDMLAKHMDPTGYADADKDPHNIDAKIAAATANFVTTTEGHFLKNKPTFQKAPGTLRIPLVSEADMGNAFEDYRKTDGKDIILGLVDNKLVNYANLDSVYTKDKVYNKTEVDNKVNGFVKKDGTVAFTSPISGVYPKLNSHLTTLQYVKDQILKHIAERDPHGYISLLNSRLLQYAKVSNVYDKTETYSRTQLDAAIRDMVDDAAKEMITDHTNQYDPHNTLTKIDSKGYVKQDGTIPFKNRVKGVDAIDAQDLVTYHQLTDELNRINKSIKDAGMTWITSGPVETTVGFIEDNSEVPAVMTFQQLCDAIFYGNTISLNVPDYVEIDNTAEITVCVHGGTVDYAQLWQDDTLIYTFQASDLVDGCITVDSEIIKDDTKFILKVFYTNGAMHEETKTVKCSLPVFVGLLPKWKFGSVVTMEYLKELEKEDADGTQNRFVTASGDVKSISFKYVFQDDKLRHPFIVLPASYPNLSTMTTKSQSFDKDAFDIIDMIPLRVSNKDVIYKMYIYNEALSSLNQEVTYNFSK